MEAAAPLVAGDVSQSNGDGGTSDQAAVKGYSAEEMVRMADLLGGGNAARLFAIAKDKSLAAEEKMIKLLEMDSQFVAYNSPRWAELLGVSETAIKRTDIWKKLQKRKRAG